MEIKIGSVVKLKSGGAEMTVSKIETDTVNGVVTYKAVCGWHAAGNKPQLVTYPFHMIELVK